jgi:anti-sigma factor RsiW
MTSIGNGHLTDKQLLFYADGELASGESARVRKHLEACWTCRAKL